jgi:Gpi18-like mannosyltransferase
MKKDDALQKAIEEVLGEWCLCRKYSDGSIHECNTHEIIKNHTWEIRSKFEDGLEKLGIK